MLERTKGMEKGRIRYTRPPDQMDRLSISGLPNMVLGKETVRQEKYKRGRMSENESWSNFEYIERKK